MPASAIPLSTSPRARKLAPGSSRPTLQRAVFGERVVALVGLHVHRAWGIAVSGAPTRAPVELERQPDNPMDANAVAAYTVVDGKRRRLGFISADEAGSIAEALDGGVRLRASFAGSAPWAGAGSKGGTVALTISL